MRIKRLNVGALLLGLGFLALAAVWIATPDLVQSEGDDDLRLSSAITLADDAADDKKTKAPLVAGAMAQQDALYEQLYAAPTPEKALGIAKTIEANWQHQGGSAANLLAERALVFARRGEMEKAITLMDQVVLVQPSYADGWRRRAQLYMQRSNTDRAMLDLRETLRHEPRHYQAWVALGSILEANEDPYRALAAYRRALGIFPHLPSLKEKVDALSATVRGYSL